MAWTCSADRGSSGEGAEEREVVTGVRSVVCLLGRAHRTGNLSEVSDVVRGVGQNARCAGSLGQRGTRHKAVDLGLATANLSDACPKYQKESGCGRPRRRYVGGWTSSSCS